MRRALRILPLYLGALAVVFILLPAIGLLDWQPLSPVQSWLWLHCSNFGMYLNPQAFTAASVDTRHFWSLAVEEHYYLAWPAVVYFAGRAQLHRVCILLIAGALLLRGFAVLQSASPYFFVLTPCRIDALAIGSLIAVAAADFGLDRMVPVARRIFVLSGAMILACFVAMKGLWPTSPLIQSVGLTVIALLFGSGMVLLLSLPEGSTPHALAASGPLRFFGKYSYGIYVIHGLLAVPLDHAMPLAAFLPLGDGVAVLAQMFAKILVVTLLAVASWHAFENPFLQLKRRFEFTDRPARQPATPLPSGSP
jgi:peptidoglycan/LPS O-acetylase OafA/YrhL